jgi:hypothetical protein
MSYANLRRFGSFTLKTTYMKGFSNFGLKIKANKSEDMWHHH